jgi:hypothetical protein
MSIHAETPRYPRWSKPAVPPAGKPAAEKSAAWPRVTPQLRTFPRR